MKFLLDQNIYHKTEIFLKNLGYDVLTLRELGLHKAADEELILYVRKLNRILITRDKDFGHLVFVKDMKAGVILLKLNPGNLERVHHILNKVLKTQKERLNSAFVVVSSSGYRIRWLR
ncbi:DUF5615 family PIN-like protein [Thermodesulfatator atlanticus]|uniref:DUF5615 family PIN-like protein n=1 Tax=Thermodesulfatator atlanticus TaxID=501497 RepID=UPI0003B5DB8B|nr:DUF5615 family PIN-like protein [Thermodesulfatator atlanticus]